MKKLLIALFVSSVASAVPVNCVITDGNGLEKTIVHDLNLNAHGPLDNITGSTIGSGFISSSNSHLVISLSDIRTGVTLSAYGSPVDGKSVLAQAIFGIDKWINVECKQDCFFS